MASAMPAFWNVGRVLTLAALAIGGLAQAASAIIVGWCAVQLLTHGFNWLLFAILFLAGFASGALTIVLRRKAEEFALERVHELRLATVDLTLRMEDGKTAMGHGVLMARVVNDFSAIKLWLSDGLVNIVLAVGVLTGCVLGTFVLVPEFAPWFMVAFGIASTPIVLLVFWLKQVIARARRERGRLANHISRTAQNRHWWIGVGRYSPLMERTKRISRRLQTQLVRRATLGAVGKACGDLFPFVFVVLAVVMIADRSDVSDVAIVLLILGLAGTQFALLARAVELALANAVAHQKLRTVFQATSLPKLRKGQKYMPDKTQPLLEINQSHRCHSGELPIIIEPGMTALIKAADRTSAGRVTAEFAGFSKPGMGKIRLRGNDFASLRLRDIYRWVSVVTQEPIHVRGTLLDAICTGVPSSTDDDTCRTAAHRVGIGDAELAMSFNGSNPIPARLAVMARFANAIVRKSELIVLFCDDALSSPGLLKNSARLVGETRMAMIVVSADAHVLTTFKEVCPLSQIVDDAPSPERALNNKNARNEMMAAKAKDEPTEPLV